MPHAPWALVLTSIQLWPCWIVTIQVDTLSQGPVSPISAGREAEGSGKVGRGHTRTQESAGS